MSCGGDFFTSTEIICVEFPIMHGLSEAVVNSELFILTLGYHSEGNVDIVGAVS